MGPAAPPAPCPQPLAPLPPSGVGSGSRGHDLQGSVFSKLRRYSGLSSEPRPAPQGPSARPACPRRGPGAGGTPPQAGVEDGT